MPDAAQPPVIVTWNKQKVLQAILFGIAGCGFIASLAPIVVSLPKAWQPTALAIIGFAYALEKYLVSTNQILVGPTKLQNAATQTALAALPDKAIPPDDEIVLKYVPGATSPATSIDTSKPITPLRQP